MKKYVWIIAVAVLIFSLSGCADKAEPIIPESDSAQMANEEVPTKTPAVQTVEPTVSSGSNETDMKTDDEVTTAPETEDSTSSETAEPPAETVKPSMEPTKPRETPESSSIPTETKPEQAEPPKQPEPQDPQPPVESEPTEPTPTETPVIVADPFEVEAKVAAYISQYRGSNVTVLAGLARVARYRSQQLVSDFSHSDGIDACNALQYGEYVDMTLYGCPESDNYYQGYNREAIAKGNWGGTADEIAQKIATGFKNSASHWQYLGSSEYPYIAVGCTYDSATSTWYCCICISSTNYGG